MKRRYNPMELFGSVRAALDAQQRLKSVVDYVTGYCEEDPELDLLLGSVVHLSKGDTDWVEKTHAKLF